jgi:general secretion pathway protein A
LAVWHGQPIREQWASCWYNDRPVTIQANQTQSGGYERFFGLNEPPFSLAPNPRFLFDSASHAAALAQIAHAVERREPLVVVTGEIGTGKTLLCRTVLERVDRKTFVAVINDPLLERDDLLKGILQDFGVISKDRTKLKATTRHELIHALQEYLASLSPLKAHAVVIIDEAQHLQADVLEQIRLLSNIDDERGTMLQIILLGQPELSARLAMPEFRQFEQRVSRRIHLAPLTAGELERYIEHRMTVAGGGQTPSRTEAPNVTFTPEAMHAILTISGGVPRVINILCDRALEAACAQWQRTIDKELITTTAAELGLAERPAPAASQPSPPARPDPVDRIEPDMFDPAPFLPDTAPAGISPRQKGLIVAAAVMLGAIGIWFATGSAGPATDTEPPAAESAPLAPGNGAAAAPATSSSPSSTAPGAAGVAPSTPNPTPAPPRAAAPSPSPSTSTPSAAAANERFEIVVASFRTEQRATSVAAEVTALGVPVRQRLAGGWQQVLAGPFNSRVQAEETQQRLDSAGMQGTQIVPTTR